MSIFGVQQKDPSVVEAMQYLDIRGKRLDILPLPNILEDYMQTMQNESDHVEHVVCEGSREHVLWWDSYGRHCSEKKCEINFQLNSTTVNIEQEITYLQEITYEHTGRVP